MARLKEGNEPLVLKLLSFYKFVPMTENNSIGILKFVKNFEEIYNNIDLLSTAKKITVIFMKS